MNYYPHHIGDYLKDTAHLTMLEDGAYRRLIDLYYQHELPLPADKRQVYRLARAIQSAERKAIDTMLSEYFMLSEDGWRHKRCDAEIGKSIEKSAKARESAAKRWQSEVNANAYANASPNASNPHTEGNAYPITNNQEPKIKKKRAPSKTALPENFGVSDSVAKWAMQNGHTHLAERLEHFLCSAKAKGYTYADWDQALMNAIRNDWAKLNGSPGRPSNDDRLGGAL